MNVTAAIITYNEEEMIGNCLTYLASLKNITHINILDSFSTDKTLDFCYGFIKTSNKSWTIGQNEFSGFHAHRNFQWRQCEDGWILWIDADETFSQNLDEFLGNLGNYPNIESWNFDHVILYPDKKNRLDKLAYSTRLIRKGSFWFNEEYPYSYIQDESKKSKAEGIFLKDHQFLKSDKALLEKGKRLKSLGLLDNPNFESSGQPEDSWVIQKRDSALLPRVPLDKSLYDITTEGI